MINLIRPKLTVLTDPVPYGRNLIPETAKSLARMIRDRIRPHPEDYNRSKYRGHPDVTRSLIEGLITINASFNYNPKSPKEFADIVVVLSGIETLRQMILSKRKGLIRTLYAGPNIVVFSSDYNSILSSPEIDWVITPCEWVVDLYMEDSPSLKGRCVSWPAGVDTKYWCPDERRNFGDILFFEKKGEGMTVPIRPYIEYLCELGKSVSVIRYGDYSHAQYLQTLKRSSLMIGFSASESQGLAWAEAWSVDVPTLLWKNTSNVHRGRKYHCSTAPYLCAQNGLFFDNFEDFKRKFSHWEANRGQFAPREWAVGNMSDEVCATNLYERVTEC